MLRSVIIILIISFLMLMALEGVVRFFVPPEENTIYLDGQAPALADSELPYVYRPNARWITKKPEFSVEYFTNNQGFRDRSIYTSEKRPGTYRILILGDSFTFGAASNYESIWPVLLEKRFLGQGYPLEIIKAGMSAYDTHSELIYLKRLIRQYKPNLVLIGLHVNDLLTARPYQAGASHHVGSGIEYDSAIQKNNGNKEFDFRTLLLLKLFLGKFDKLYVMHNLHSGWDSVLNLDSEFRKRQVAITQELLSLMKEETSFYGADFAVVSLPLYCQVIIVARDYAINGIDPHINDKNLSAGLDKVVWISTLDRLADAYKKEKKDLYYRHDGHLNPRGNEIVAELLYEQLAPKIRIQR